MNNTRRFFLRGCAAAACGGMIAALLPGGLSRPAASPAKAAELDDFLTAPGFASETQLHLGTFVSVTLRHESRTLRQEAMGRAFEMLPRLESVFTCHRAGSPLDVLNTRGALNDAPPELYGLMREAMRIAKASNGAFNPAAYTVLSQLRACALSSVADLPAAERNNMLSAAKPGNIILNAAGQIKLASQDTRLSLDGIAKGYIVDALSKEIAALGIKDHLINAGGDLYASGHRAPGKPWRIGVQKADAPAKTAMVMELSDQGLATSGNFESFNNEGRNHLIALEDVSVSNLLSMTATAPNAMLADAWATAAFVMPANGPGRLLRREYTGAEQITFSSQGA